MSRCKCQCTDYIDLSDKVSVLLDSFHEFLSTLPEAFVLLDLPGLQLRNDGGFLLLLSEILIESQRIVGLFLLAVPGTAVRPLGRFFGVRSGGRGRGRGRGGPISITTFSTPVSITSSTGCPVVATRAGSPLFGGGSLFNSGIVGSSSLDCEFCLAFITTPRLVDLLVRVADRGLG